MLANLLMAFQGLYTTTMMTCLYLSSKKPHYVTDHEIKNYPFISLFYPLLNEEENVIVTTLTPLEKMEYPTDRYEVLAITNYFDHSTNATIKKLQNNFPHLKHMIVPKCSDESWDLIWKNWTENEKCYWWHEDGTASKKDLPRKKTRQLIYAFYHKVEERGDNWILDYVDADSVSPLNHFKLGAAGLTEADVVQSTNVTGNLMETTMSTLCSVDHMFWDATLYPHMSGGQPYYLLGKGLFLKAKDLKDLGGFNPWLAIEDPEVGLRFWKNGKKLGILNTPLIEESPIGFMEWLHQRNRWLLGFYQTLATPLTRMNFTWTEKIKARINLIPTLSMILNPMGLTIGIYTIHQTYITQTSNLPSILNLVCNFNIALIGIMLIGFYKILWQKSKQVLPFKQRIKYLIKLNPITLFSYWTLWSIPVIGGFLLYLAGKGKSWRRTKKFDSNHDLIRTKYKKTFQKEI